MASRAMRYPLSAFAALLCRCSSLPPVCEAGLVQLAITNGTESASYLALLAAQQNAVIAVTFALSSGAPQLCSGVLIAPDLALSAAHCAHDVDPPRATVPLGASVDAPLWTTSATAVAGGPLTGAMGSG